MNPTPVRPMLGDIELRLVQKLRTEEDRVWVEHAVPALEGSLVQHLGRGPVRVRVEGVMADTRSLEDLEGLRQLYQAAAPVVFAADIMTATLVKQVVISDLVVRELAGRPQRYHYALTLVEFIPPPEPVTPGPGHDPNPPPNPVPPDGRTGAIEVTVILPRGQTDFAGVVVRIERTDVEGQPPVELTEQVEGVYRRDQLTAGEYRATALRRV